MSWSCLPHAVSSLIRTGAAIINEWWICGGVGTLFSVLFFTASTGSAVATRVSQFSVFYGLDDCR